MLYFNITFFYFYFSNSNSSGSKETSTSIHHRGRTETSGVSGQENPTQPAIHDKYKDLTALVIEPKSHIPALFEKVIVKSDVDEINPTIGEMIDVKIR